MSKALQRSFEKRFLRRLSRTSNQVIEINWIFYLKKKRNIKKKLLNFHFYSRDLSNGEAWYKFRTATSKIMLNPKYVKSYHNSIGQVCDDFLERYETIVKGKEKFGNVPHRRNDLNV